MIQIKATNFISTKKFVLEKYDEVVLNSALQQVSDENRTSLIRSPLLASDWIPMDAWIEFFHSLMKVCNAKEDLVEEAGGYNAEKELTGVFKIFVRLLSPAYFLEKSPLFMEKYFKKDDGKITVTIQKNSSNDYLGIVSGFSKEHRLFEVGVVGWMKKTLELGGAKNIDVKITESLSTGNGRFVLSLRWFV